MEWIGWNWKEWLNWMQWEGVDEINQMDQWNVHLQNLGKQDKKLTVVTGTIKKFTISGFAMQAKMTRVSHCPMVALIYKKNNTSPIF